MDGEQNREVAAPRDQGAGDPDGGVLSPLDRIVSVTERELAALAERVEAETKGMSERTDRRVRELALDRRRQLALARAELIDRVTALAIRFEGLLEVLDAADGDLNRAIEEAGPSHVEGGLSGEAIEVTMSERRSVTASHDVSEENDVPEQIEAPPASEPPTPLRSQPTTTPRPAAPPERLPGEPGPGRRWTRWWRQLRRGAA